MAPVNISSFFLKGYFEIIPPLKQCISQKFSPPSPSYNVISRHQCKSRESLILTPACRLFPRLGIRAAANQALDSSVQRAAAGCMEALLTLRLKFCGKKRHFTVESVNAPSAPVNCCKDLTKFKLHTVQTLFRRDFCVLLPSDEEHVSICTPCDKQDPQKHSCACVEVTICQTKDCLDSNCTQSAAAADAALYFLPGTLICSVPLQPLNLIKAERGTIIALGFVSPFAFIWSFKPCVLGFFLLLLCNTRGLRLKGEALCRAVRPGLAHRRLYS